MVYVLYGHSISADKVFSMAQYFNILQLTMAIWYPTAVAGAAEAAVSIKRIEVRSIYQVELKKINSKIKKIKHCKSINDCHVSIISTEMSSEIDILIFEYVKITICYVLFILITVIQVKIIK